MGHDKTDMYYEWEKQMYTEFCFGNLAKGWYYKIKKTLKLLKKLIHGT